MAWRNRLPETSVTENLITVLSAECLDTRECAMLQAGWVNNRCAWFRSNSGARSVALWQTYTDNTCFTPSWLVVSHTSASKYDRLIIMWTLHQLEHCQGRYTNAIIIIIIISIIIIIVIVIISPFVLHSRRHYILGRRDKLPLGWLCRTSTLLPNELAAQTALNRWIAT